jgi:hypothetical protein
LLEDFEAVLQDGRLLYGQIVSVRDISQHKKAEEELNKRMEALLSWESMTLRRESRILELKKEVNALLVELGKPWRYSEDEEVLSSLPEEYQIS